MENIALQTTGLKGETEPAQVRRVQLLWGGILKVGAGQIIANICTDCVVLTGTTSIEAKGDATVKIERGEVSIDGKR